MSGGRSEILHRLTAVVDRVEATGDAAELLDPATLELAQQALPMMLQGGRLDVELTAAVGRFYWARAGHDPSAEDDRLVALEFFGLVARVDPRRVPPDALRALTGSGQDDGEAGDDQSLLADLADHTLRFAEQRGVPAAVLRLISALPELLDIAPGDGESIATVLSMVGTTLLQRPAAGATATDLAVELLTGAQAAAPGPELRAMITGDLALAHRIRFEERGDPADLRTAERMVRAVLDSGTGPAVLTGNLWYVLASVLLLRAEHGNDGVAARAAAEAARAAVRAGGDFDHRAGALDCLSLALRQIAQITGDHGAFDEAVTIGREALAAAVPAEERARIAVSLAGTLRLRYDARGDVRDLDEAAAAIGHGAVVGGVGFALESGAIALRRFERDGDPARADEAVRALAEAVEGTPQGPARARRTADLSLAFLRRFEVLGERADAEQAVAAGREAVRRMPAGSPGEAEVNSQLAIALSGLFHRSREHRIADEAIEAARRAVHLGQGRPELYRYHFNLAHALMQRWSDVDEWLSTTGAFYGIGLAFDPGDLDEAVTAAMAAVEAIPAGYRNEPAYQAMLGSTRWARHLRTGSETDRLAAITAFRAAVAVCTEDPRRCDWELWLAHGLWRPTATPADRDPADRAEAAGLFGRVSRDPAATVSTRVRAGRALGDLASQGEDWPLALDGYASAVELLPTLAWRGLGGSALQDRLRDCAGLGSLAASAAIAAGEPQRALELLEAARGVALSQVAPLTDTPDRLAAVDSGLAAELVDLHRRLAEPGPGERSRRELGRRWDEVVARVRALPGWDGFLRTPGFAALCAAAAEGPVVAVNVSRLRCDALILTTGGVRALELPGLTLDKVIRQAHAFRDAVAEPARLRARMIAAEVSAWLWTDVAAPVLAALDATGELGSRLWWCPTGPLAFLPLHAAGDLPDRVISSYAPTLRSLLAARTHRPATDLSSLVVAVARAPGLPDLPHSAAEAEAVAALVPRPTVLIDDRATSGAILEGLNRSRVAHLACHGFQESGGEAFLALADVRVRIGQLPGVPERETGLVFLSACDTARGDETLPDESLHFGASLHVAGWTQVVGTAWSVPDEPAAALAAHFYRELDLPGRGGAPLSRDVAAALHAAVRQARRDRPGDLLSWGPFLHIGP